MKIKSYLHEYEIDYVSGFKFLSELMQVESKLIVVDQKVYGLYSDVINNFFDSDNIFLIDALEEKKCIESALSICDKAMGINAKRNLTLIAIGGGIVQDVVAFAANILYRGVNLVLVPTTLLAQGDSCIGSKSSLNYNNFKNILGSFFPPKKVYICFDFLSTLSDMDFRSGLCEMVRFHIMDNITNVEMMNERLDKLLMRDISETSMLMKEAHAYKKTMVELDEFDLNKRNILNYGHTFGHAIEATSGYSIPHGLAVALGIIAENSISVRRGILDGNTAGKLESVFLRMYNAEAYNCDNRNKFIDCVMNDKKRGNKGIASVLMSSGGNFSVHRDITQGEVFFALDKIISINTGGRLC
jgi:3-dehydroquinate synthase